MNAALKTSDGFSTAAGRQLLATIDDPLTDLAIRRLDAFDRIFGGDRAEVTAVICVGDMLERMAQRVWGPAGYSWARRAKTLTARYESADEDLHSLEACLLRVLDPFNGILTVPLGSMFTASECDAIVAERTPQRIERPDLNQPVGHAIDYTGYMCVVLKVTRLCNLRCTYCHDWSASPASGMTTPVLLRVIAESLSCGAGAIDFVLHGGEPLMMGRQTFRKLLALQAHLLRPSQSVRMHVQTNATLVDEWWISALSLFGIKVSVSLDGPAAVHDRTRIDTLGRGTFKRVVDGLHLLQRNGLLSGTLIVVSREVLSIGAEHVLQFLNDGDISSVSFLPERPAAGSGVPESNVSADEFVQFLIAFDTANRGGKYKHVNVRELDAVANVLRGVPSQFCELAGNCVGTFVSVDANGDVSHCDKYVGDGDYVVGNLNEHRLSEILRSERMRAVAERAYAPLKGLSSCPFFTMCQGWCPHERYVAPMTSRPCCGLSALFEHLQKRGQETHG